MLPLYPGRPEGRGFYFFYDGSLSDEGRRLARESAEVLRAFLMVRGVFLTC